MAAGSGRLIQSIFPQCFFYWWARLDRPKVFFMNNERVWLLDRVGNGGNRELRKFAWISLGLFASSLVLPAAGWTDPFNPSLRLFGWHCLAASFIGLAAIAEVFTAEPGLMFYILSGTVTNLLLLVGWIGLYLGRTGAKWTWAAAFGLVFASVSLIRLTPMMLGPAYWLWLGASAVTFWARFRPLVPPMPTRSCTA